MAHVDVVKAVGIQRGYDTVIENGYMKLSLAAAKKGRFCAGIGLDKFLIMRVTKRYTMARR